MAESKPRAKRKKVAKKTQRLDSGEESDDDLHGKTKKRFTYLAEIEKLDVSNQQKRNLLKLCKTVEKTFKLTAKQIEKVRKMEIKEEDVKALDCKFTLGRGLYKADKGEKPFDMSAFTAQEVGKIKENFSRFCLKFGFDEDEDLNIFLPSTFVRRNDCVTTLSVPQLHLFTRYLCQNLPHRPPRSVYRKFTSIFYCYRTGVFSRHEDKLLKTWYEMNPDNYVFAILGRILRRSRFLVRRRVMKLIDHKPRYVEEITNHRNDTYPDWTKEEEVWERIASTSGQTNVKQLKKTYFQDLCPSVRASKRITSSKFKAAVLNELLSIEEPAWDNVDWRQLGEKCFNVGAVRVYSVIRSLTKKYVPKEQWGDLAAALKTLDENRHLFIVKRKYTKRTETLLESDEEDETEDSLDIG